ncbi:MULTISPECIES: IclR family transcriptional regulator [unclassified Variovorax]|uniref:IclR family transcriptional regulator n=1 Tax=unclassified Variovorax TaxID=663243 RepID=UPI001BD5A753|nr:MULTISPECIES: IclR family transcriptional regulator [unclassified Variovorax]
MNEEVETRQQRGIQSVEVGGQLLRALVHHGRPMALSDLAREADMAPAKAHPYMVSFGRLGLIEQDPVSGQYLLGPLAMQLGLIGLQQNNPVQIASPLIEALAASIGQTVAIAVWGDRGATIVRLAESPAAVHVVMRHGTVFSLTDTASGRLFGAYMEPAVVKRFLEEERSRRKQRDRGDPTPQPGMPAAAPVPNWREFETHLEEVKRHGLSRSTGEIVPGVNAMAAPVFDHKGTIVLAVTAIGAAGVFDSSWDGEVARALKACASQVSRRLGAPAT